MSQQFKEVISTEAELRAIMGTPGEGAKNKVIAIVDEHCQKFIANSPFLTIASTNANGQVDVSPKGDPAGFVKVLDEKTLAIPERLGNKRADTFVNILNHSAVGLLFMIPGITETLRVNGKAKIITDLAIREQLAVTLLHGKFMKENYSEKRKRSKCVRFVMQLINKTQILRCIKVQKKINQERNIS